MQNLDNVDNAKMLCVAIFDTSLASITNDPKCASERVYEPSLE